MARYGTVDRRAHWNETWTTRDAASVSWYQAEPEPSLSLVKSVTAPSDSIIDVGGGASGLSRALVEAGYLDVTVLDVSAAALDALEAHLESSPVRTIEADVLEYPFAPGGTALWHDRAVFHFLVEPNDRERYRAQLDRAVRAGGYAVIGTFAADGPTKCSGLPVERYDGEALSRELGANWQALDVLRHEHRTPNGVVQPFTFLLARHAR